MQPEPRLIVALDVASAADARALAMVLRPYAGVFKIGLELLFNGGAELARELAARGVRVFVDAKLLDIDNTVERATAAIASLGAQYVTIHAHDRRTAEAAVRGRGSSALRLLGVTVMTHLRDADLRRQGHGETCAELALRRATAARDGGIDGVIASAREAAAIRRLWPDALIATPGIRAVAPAGDDDDQARVATPGDALRAGADLLVVGRPIVAAADPAAAARAIVAAMQINGTDATIG